MTADHQPKRPEFSDTQRLQANHIGRVTDEQRAARKQIPTFPIDNVTPDTVSDRDDGIFVEAEQRGGGYRVHITIADVAAHVRAGSPLGNAAWQRAFTVYGPGWTDPMFPKILEENLSLEHNQERLGLTVSITLDKNFQPIHTNFAPVITRPDSTSYDMAQKRMASDPQFQMMDTIAQGVRAGYFGSNNEAWRELLEQRRSRGVHSERQMKAMEMVATYMLLANSCVAQFFSKTDLPFLYRNFNTDQGDAHASYGTTPERHSALESDGLKGAYCHFTSPIRRAPDYFNGVMVHYAIDVIGEIERQMKAAAPALDTKRLSHALWEHGPRLVGIGQGMTVNPDISTRRKLQQLITEAANQAMPDGLELMDATAAKIVKNLQLPSLPLSRAQLENYAGHMNELAHAPQQRALQRLNEQYDRVEALAENSKEALAEMSREKFTSTLRAAAATGHMPRPLFDETIARIKSANYDKVTDAFTILLQAQWPGAQRWLALKREMAREIKHDPNSVNALMERLEKAIAPITIQKLETLEPVASADGEMNGDSRISSALMVMQADGMPAVAAPFRSVGHNKRAALSHARYSFLEHYAFGQLQPLEQTAIPNLLYAELDMGKEDKKELLKRMVQEVGASLTVSEGMTELGYRTEIIVHGGDVSVPIQVQAVEASAEEATQSAVRRMLRNDAFKTAVSREQDIAPGMLNPQTVLEELVAKRGGKLTFERVSQQGIARHRMIAVMELDGNERRFHGNGPNIDRATRAASVKALSALGWELQDDEKSTDAEKALKPPAQSWVTDMASSANGRQRHYAGNGNGAGPAK